ncbi:MAG: M20/M25/M40 family metallo-hydrolase, partial [Saezia sp.]
MNKERVLKEFFELVQIDSPTHNERAIADVLKAKLKAIGADEVWEDDVGEKIGGNAGNVMALFKGNKADAPCVMFSAHMDSVVPCIGIKPVLKEGVISSAGDTILGSDDKSGIVAILEAVRVMKEQNFPHGDVQVAFTVAEEGGLHGAKNMDKKHLKADFGYAFDSSGSPGKVIIMAPGQYKIVSVFKGKTAHAGIAPEDGLNAIVLAAKALAEVKDGRMDEETTCNIGLIQAGAATNIVPDACTVTSEARSCNSDKLDALVKDIQETFERVAAKNGGSVEVTLTKAYNPYVLNEKDGLVQLA